MRKFKQPLRLFKRTVLFHKQMQPFCKQHYSLETYSMYPYLSIHYIVECNKQMNIDTGHQFVLPCTIDPFSCLCCADSAVTRMSENPKFLITISEYTCQDHEAISFSLPVSIAWKRERGAECVESQPGHVVFTFCRQINESCVVGSMLLHYK